MPYVERKNGAIVGLYANKQAGYAEELLADDNADVLAFFRAPSFKSLSRPAFLFMMGKLGVTIADVDALIAALPSGTQEEQDKKALAALVFANTNTFKRDNDLLNSLVAASPLTDAQIDAAWRVAEGLTW